MALCSERIQCWRISELRMTSPIRRTWRPLVDRPRGVYTFNDNSTGVRRFLAQATTKRLAPVSISKASSANLLTPTTGADYIVIAPKEFVGVVEPLAQLREPRLPCAGARCSGNL